MSRTVFLCRSADSQLRLNARSLTRWPAPGGVGGRNGQDGREYSYRGDCREAVAEPFSTNGPDMVAKFVEGRQGGPSSRLLIVSFVASFGQCSRVAHPRRQAPAHPRQNVVTENFIAVRDEGFRPRAVRDTETNCTISVFSFSFMSYAFRLLPVCGEDRIRSTARPSAVDDGHTIAERGDE